MPTLPVPGPRFWPQEGSGHLPTLFLPPSLLRATHHGLGAFCTEEGFISWALGCPEEVAALRFGGREKEKVGGNAKFLVAPPRAQGLPVQLPC